MLMKNNELSILCIDDEEMIRMMISDFLEDSGYTVFTAENGLSGLELLRENHPDLILVDLMMPEMDGLEFLSRAVKESPDTPIIVISGTGAIQDVVEAVRRGAWDYLSKPIQDLVVLEHVVNKALEKALLTRENEAYRKDLEEKVRERTLALEKTLWDTVSALSSMTDKRDPYTSGHQKRVSILAKALGEKMGLSGDTVEGIRIAGLLHDIGKIYVPAEFLAKPARLEYEEMEIMKKHAFMGYDILINIDFPWPVAEIVYQHHERIDGSGYPRNLEDSDILPEAKIIAIVDVFEAMSSHRPYRPSLNPEIALREIVENRGKFYSQNCADAFIELFQENSFDTDEFFK